jgi:hypothetical protein
MYTLKTDYTNKRAQNNRHINGAVQTNYTEHAARTYVGPSDKKYKRS